MIRAKIIVKLKEEISDAAGRTVATRLADAGFTDVAQARIGKLIELDFNTSDLDTVNERVLEMAKKILVSPSTEELEIVSIDTV